MSSPDLEKQAQFAGHPSGLFMLFFAEMWERFSYYGMRALLVLYILKGFLSASDDEAYAIYGAYAGLVYATPFLGGILADRYIGSRRAVILGGVLMAAGHLLMTIESEVPFFGALALLIVGNGFFKPNISAIVGSLYPEGSPKRDAGFTIFYIGINMGAAMAPLLCGYLGEKYGWHYGFGLATIGMLVGLAVFVVPAYLSRFAILFTAFASGGAMIYLNLDESIYALGPNAGVAIALGAAGLAAFLAMGQGGLPEWAGAPRDKALADRTQWWIYLGSVLIVPVIAGVMLADGKLGVLFAIVGVKVRLVGLVMLVLGGIGTAVLVYETVRSTAIERDRMIVVMVMMFFSMLFWAFFEQAGSSINLFTDRNVDRVFETSVLTADQVGSTVVVDLTQELNGRTLGDKTITMADIDGWRAGVAGYGLTLADDGARADWASEEGHSDPLADYPVVLTHLLPGSPAAEARSAVEAAPAPPEPAPEPAAEDPAAEGEEAAAAAPPPPAPPAAPAVPLATGQVVRSVALGGAAAQDLAGLSAKEVAALLDEHEGDVVLEVQDLEVARDDEGHITAVTAGDQHTFSVSRASDRALTLPWPVSDDDVGMGTAGSEVATSQFQAANPVFILIFGLVFSALWTFLGKMKLEPSTPVKFGLGIGQLALGFAALWWGAQVATPFGIVGMGWLLLAYLLITTGELCLSPVGLSMVTKLSPTRIVSMVMGAWFLATAFSNYLAAIIAAFTGVGHGGGGHGELPPPIETVVVYGDVFAIIAVTAGISALVVFAMSPLLSRMMHMEESELAGGGH